MWQILTDLLSSRVTAVATCTATMIVTGSCFGANFMSQTGSTGPIDVVFSAGVLASSVYRGIYPNGQSTNPGKRLSLSMVCSGACLGALQFTTTCTSMSAPIRLGLGLLLGEASAMSLCLVAKVAKYGHSLAAILPISVAFLISHGTSQVLGNFPESAFLKKSVFVMAGVSTILGYFVPISAPEECTKKQKALDCHFLRNIVWLFVAAIQWIPVTSWISWSDELDAEMVTLLTKMSTGEVQLPKDLAKVSENATMGGPISAFLGSLLFPVFMEGLGASVASLFGVEAFTFSSILNILPLSSTPNWVGVLTSGVTGLCSALTISPPIADILQTASLLNANVQCQASAAVIATLAFGSLISNIDLEFFDYKTNSLYLAAAAGILSMLNDYMYGSKVHSNC